MPKKRKAPEAYESGGSEEVTGTARNPADLTVQELMYQVADPARPDWMVTRFPVSMEEFDELNEAAIEPEPREAVAEAAEIATEDPATEAPSEAPEDPPEGQIAVSPDVAAPGMPTSFRGITQTAWRPPDATLAVGPSDVMLSVNADLAVYTKTGTLRFRWPNLNTFFAPVLPAGANTFDPKLVYDHYAGRWVVICDARRPSPAGSWIMLAASRTNNPVGTYSMWSLDAALDGNAATDNWADFTQLGLDTQAIYLSNNMFQIGGGFRYVKLRTLNKAEVYTGGAIRWWDFWNLKNPDGSSAFTVQPAMHFRGLGGNPPAYLVNAVWPQGSRLTLWKLDNPLGFWTGTNPALARDWVSCAAYDLPPDGAQPGTSVRIETNDNRVLHAVFQNVDGAQRLWACQTSRHTWSGDSEARSVVQWYEIDVPTKAVNQQGRFGASGLYYFYPAIQTDISRNGFVVFGRCGASEFAQLRQSGRRVSDAPNSLQGSALIKSGESAYTGGRWGDYFGICRDGADAAVVWMYGDYAGASNTWGTWVAAARF
jgi:hypothetical protein